MHTERILGIEINACKRMSFLHYLQRSVSGSRVLGIRSTIIVAADKGRSFGGCGDAGKTNPNRILFKPWQPNMKPMLRACMEMATQRDRGKEREGDTHTHIHAFLHAHDK